MIAPAIHELESRLCALLGRRHCVVVGRGATAIYIALRTLRRRGRKIVVPATVCPAPANAALYAGFDPVFCDVSLNDFNLDHVALEKVLATHSDVAAVMPAHLFGQAAPMDEISSIARAHGLPVIEDAAQALGGSYRGQSLGTFGDISILSFGHTKTIDASQAGAALTDDDDLAAGLRAACASLPPCPADLDLLEAEYRHVYYTLKSLADASPRLDELFLSVPGLYRDLHLFALDPARAPSITASLEQLSELVAARRTHAMRYRLALDGFGFHLPRYDAEAAPWRFSFLVGTDRATALTAALRSEGLDVSNWYPALPRWYASGRIQDRGLFPNADRIAREVVNLWVEPRCTAAQIERTCAAIRRFMKPSATPLAPLLVTPS
jgi:dTDP-4-amino-4,6-dideoxygalactose transaminase